MIASAARKIEKADEQFATGPEHLYLSEMIGQDAEVQSNVGVRHEV